MSTREIAELKAQFVSREEFEIMFSYLRGFILNIRAGEEQRNVNVNLCVKDFLDFVDDKINGKIEY